MTELSIIIPIYNTPLADLQRCFDSVTADHWEVILIDDGSEEQVGQFCREYAQSHSQFQYHYQENSGVSAARNLGIQKATGTYVTFLDADDRLLCKPLEEALVQAQDLIFFDILLTQKSGDSTWSAFQAEAGQLTAEQVIYQLCTSASISGPVAKLYRRQLILDHNIRFDPRFITGEDWMFVCDCAIHSRSFLYVQQEAYQYYRTAATSQGRLLRFPDTMLRNLVDRHNRKLEIMESQIWEQYDPQVAQTLAARELIENLFNAAASLRLVKQLTNQRRTMIRRNAAKAAKLADNLPRKTRTKLWVLGKFPAMLYPMALLRSLYLKCKF